MNLLLVVLFFAYRQSNRQTILRRGQRTSSKGGVRAGRIFKFVKVQQEFARLVEAMRWQRGVEEAASRVSCRRARGIPNNEKEDRDSGIFKHWFKPVSLPTQIEFRYSRNQSCCGCPYQRGKRFGFRRIVGQPFCINSILDVRIVPVQAVESDKRRRLRVFHP